MADVKQTTTNLGAIVPEVWSANYYDSLLANLPFRGVIDDSYEGEISNLGDTVNISQFPEFTEGNILAEGARNDAEAVVVTQQALVINKMIVKDFILTSEAQLQSLPAMDKLQELASYAIDKKIQSEIIAASVPAVANALTYASGTTMGLADMLDAKELLDETNVSLAGRSMIMGSAQVNDIFNITGFTSSDFITSGSPLTSGELPAALLGFAPNFTTIVGNTSYFVQESYLTIAAQRGMQIKVYDLGVDGQRGVRVNLDTLIGLELLDDTRIVTKS